MLKGKIIFSEARSAVRTLEVVVDFVEQGSDAQSDGRTEDLREEHDSCQRKLMVPLFLMRTEKLKF